MLFSLILIPIIAVIALAISKEFHIKLIGLISSTINFFISLVVYINYNFSTNIFQFVSGWFTNINSSQGSSPKYNLNNLYSEENKKDNLNTNLLFEEDLDNLHEEYPSYSLNTDLYYGTNESDSSIINTSETLYEYYDINYFDFILGVDGLSIYFVLLTTIIAPISLLSNWRSISDKVKSYVIIILLLETLLLLVFLVLDILLFYIFFESILPPLFILIGIFGSDNRVKASFYLFLYTLLGSLFLLLSILTMSSYMSTTNFDALFKGNFLYTIQLFLFYGIFIAFAVKTPTIFLNTWLLKAHVESPLGGSIILAAIVLKLSLYGILRLILPVLPKAFIGYTTFIYVIGVITIVYASLSTLRTIDIKELIAYSSVSHAAVYLLGIFSNNIQGIEGGINLGLAHGLVSPGLFICAGGILYDRCHTRLITNYKGVTQLMPLFSILFFILCLGNCGAPLTLNFVGEFMSLYGVFERSSLFGVFASTSIIFSAAYTIYMYQRISFGGSYSKIFTIAIPDLNKREFMILLTLVILTVIFGIYTAPILNGIHYSVSTLIYNSDLSIILCDAPKDWNIYLDNSTISYHTLFGLFFWIVLISIIINYYKKIKFVIIPYIKEKLVSIKISLIILLYSLPIGLVIHLLFIILPILFYGLSILFYWLPSVNDIIIYYHYLYSDCYVGVDYPLVEHISYLDPQGGLYNAYDSGSESGSGSGYNSGSESDSDWGNRSDTGNASTPGNTFATGNGSSSNNGSGSGNGSGSSNNSTESPPVAHPNIADCEHPDNHRRIYTDHPWFAKHPIPCSYCNNNALNGTPFQQAIFCDSCGATIGSCCHYSYDDSPSSTPSSTTFPTRFPPFK